MDNPHLHRHRTWTVGRVEPGQRRRCRCTLRQTLKNAFFRQLTRHIGDRGCRGHRLLLTGKPARGIEVGWPGSGNSFLAEQKSSSKPSVFKWFARLLLLRGASLWTACVTSPKVGRRFELQACRTGNSWARLSSETEGTPFLLPGWSVRLLVLR